MSHAHGWSTGPTHALSTFVLGLQLLAPGGREWVLAPQFGDLKRAEGGFTTDLGKFSVKWRVVDGGYELEYDVPSETQGSLILPSGADGEMPQIAIDHQAIASALLESESGTATVNSQLGGRHSVIVRF